MKKKKKKKKRKPREKYLNGLTRWYRNEMTENTRECGEWGSMVSTQHDTQSKMVRNSRKPIRYESAWDKTIQSSNLQNMNMVL